MNLPLLLSLLLIHALALPKQTPIIGIYTQSTSSDEPKSTRDARAVLAGNYTYIAASYVKYIQMSGAQVVPLFAYSEKAYFDDILPKINGVLFPGGDEQIDIKNRWTQNADLILKYSISQTKKGNTFPIWGTCLGMQLLSYLTSGYDSSAISAVRGQLAIRNTLQIQPSNTLFTDLPSDLLYRIQSGTGIAYFNHHYAVRKEYYNRNAQLKSFWNVQAYTTTSYNQDFLSVTKAKDYPIFGVQFHPEKNLFEWKVPADRSEYGALLTQILSNKFVEFARQSKNHFDSDEDFAKVSIYNYKTQPTNMSFVQIYVFPQVHSQINLTYPVNLKKE